MLTDDAVEDQRQPVKRSRNWRSRPSMDVGISGHGVIGASAPIRTTASAPMAQMCRIAGPFCCNKPVRYHGGNDKSDWKLDDDVESGGGVSAQTPALSARRDPELRALVYSLSTEPASP
jgi:hypothetical protein